MRSLNVGEKVEVEGLVCSVAFLLVEGRLEGGGRVEEETIARRCFDGGGTLFAEGTLTDFGAEVLA